MSELATGNRVGAARRNLGVWIVVALFLVGLTIRLYGLAERDRQTDLWWDELGLLHEALGGARGPHEGPLNAWLLRAWIFVTRSTDASTLHLLPVIVGAFIPLALGRLAREIAGARAGWIALTLGILSPVGVYFSRELRPYALLSLMTALVLLLAIRSIEAPTRRRSAVDAMRCVAACLVHPAAVPVIGMGLWAQVAWLVLAWRRRDNIEWRAHVLRGSSVVAAVVVGTLWTHRTISTVIDGPYTKGLGQFFWATVPTLGSAFSPTQSAPPPGVHLTDVLSIVMLAFALFGAVHLWRTRAHVAVLLLGATLGVLGTLYFTLGSKGAWPWLRYASHLAVPFLALAAAGADTLARRFRTIGSTIVSVALLPLTMVPGVWFWLSHAETSFPLRSGNGYMTRLVALEKQLIEAGGGSRGWIFSRWRTAFSEEGDRAVLMYDRLKTLEQPVYFTDGEHVFLTTNRTSGLGVGSTRAPSLEPSDLPPGDYWLVRGADKWGCASLGMKRAVGPEVRAGDRCTMPESARLPSDSPQ